MSATKKIFLEAAIQLLALCGGFGIHVAFHRWDIVLCVVLALECFLHFIAFIWIYRSVLDKLLEWTTHGGNPLEAVNEIRNDLQHLRDNALPLQNAFNGHQASDWPFNLMWDNTVKQFVESAKGISSGRHQVSMDVVPDVSFEVFEQMEKGAFCTAVEGNLDIFFPQDANSDQGRRAELLVRKQYEAAKRLAKSGKDGIGFTRLFIFDNISRVRPAHLSFMSENNDNAIEVLVVQTDAVWDIFRKWGRQDKMDFGKWKRNLLMEIKGAEPVRMLVVSKRQEDIRDTDELIAALRLAAMPYAKFLVEFMKPVNVTRWSTTPESILRLEAPDGPDSSDCEMMLRTALDIAGEHSIKRVAIYGLTHELIETATMFVGGDRERSADVVDCRQYAPDRVNERVQFISANWLEHRPNRHKYDLVLADDALCNLTYWQTPVFFSKIAATMDSDGLFLFRTTARFEQGIENPTWDEIVQELIQFQREEHGLNINMLSSGGVCEAAWPTLHTARFYDEATRALSLKKWNDAVTMQAGFSPDFRNHLKFRRELVLTSMDYRDMRGMFDPYFKVVKREQDVFSKWEMDEKLNLHPNARNIGERFRRYYKVVVLRKK
jgi:hypothetical protein